MEAKSLPQRGCIFLLAGQRGPRKRLECRCKKTAPQGNLQRTAGIAATIINYPLFIVNY